MTGSGDAKGAARIIAINPKLRAEAQASLPWLERALDPASQEQILALLIRQAPSLRMPDLSEDGYGVLFEPYLEIFKATPIAILEEAFLRWHRGELYPKDIGRHAFFPKPAELYKLTEPAMLDLGKAKNRIRLAMAHIDDQKPEATPEERELVRAQMKAEGFLNEEGRFVLPKKGAGPRPPVTAESRQEMAARLRAAADAVDSGEEAI